MAVTKTKEVRTPAPAPGTAQPPAHHPGRLQEFKALLDARTDMFREALPPDIEVGFFKSVVYTAVQNTKDLLDCTPASIWSACRRAAHDGLVPDGREGVLIVRWKKGGTKEAGWQPMIAGIRKKVRASGEVESFVADVVHENDGWAYAKGDNEFIQHDPVLNNRGKIIGAYAIATLKSGTKIREVMGVDEMNVIRDKYSEGWKAFQAGAIKSTPWSDGPGEMYKKTVSLRLSKVLPMSTDVRAAINYSDDTPPLEQLPAPPRPERGQYIGLSKARDDVVAGDDEGTTIEGEVNKDEPKEEAKKEDGKKEEGKDKPAADQKADPKKAETKKKAPPVEEKADTPEIAHAKIVSNLRSRLEKYPRDLQNEIWDSEITPAKDQFTAEELDGFEALLKE